MALGGISIVIASPGRASVCQSDESGCTQADTYPGLNAEINGGQNGFKVVWTESAVQANSSGASPSWTAYVQMTNTTPITLDMTCSDRSSQATEDSADVSGGSGDAGTMYAENSYCDENPGAIVVVLPGGSFTDWATFGSVPGLGSEVSLTWGQWGTSASVSPFIAGAACVFDAPSGVGTIDGYQVFGHTGWGFELPGGSWEFGANEGIANGDVSETWSATGTWWQMLSTFQDANDFHPAGYYTQYRCASVNTTSANITAAENVVVNEADQLYAVPGQDCESQDYNVLAAYAISNMPTDLSVFTWPSPNNWFNNLNSAGFSDTEPI